MQLKQAVTLDPRFADAWARLGGLRISTFVGSGDGLYADARRESLAALNRAILLNPNLSAAHAQLARVYFTMDWDPKSADPELKTALALNQNDEMAHWLSGYIANIRGQFSEAVRFHRRALELDPLLLDNLRQLGNAYYRSGQLDEAEAVLRSGVQRCPDARTFHYRLGLVLLAKGKNAAALAEFKAEKDQDFLVVGVPLALDALGQREEADRVLAKAIGDEHVANGAAYQIGLVYAARGDEDQAFAWFERAYRQRDSGMLWLKFDPLLKTLRSDPRFAALVTKMGVFD